MRKRSRFLQILGLVVGLLLTLAACAMNNAAPPMSVGPAGGAPEQPVVIAATAASKAADADNNASDLGHNQTGQQRIVLKNATLSLTVDDPVRSVAAISQLAEGVGGWVVTSNTIRNGNYVSQSTLSIRVPADRFTAILEQIKAGAVSIQGETITGDDVTAQYVDLSSQLDNLQATEAQLQKIMSTATNVDDVLQVQAKLTDVQGQIEKIKGQLKYYSEAAAYSLINLTLFGTAPTPTVTPTPTPHPLGLANWNPEGAAQDALGSLVSLGQVTISALIWFVFFILPVGLPLLIIVLVWRRFARRLTPTPAPAVKPDQP